MKRIAIVIACTLLTVVYIPEHSKAQSRDSESLKGLKGVRLTVMFGRAKAMDEAQKPMVLKLLQDDAKAKFQKAGIPLLVFADEVENAPGSPHFIVTITMDIPNGHVFPVVTKSRLLQKVRLSRDASIEMSVCTWETNGVGEYELTNLQMLRRQVGTEVDQFIEAYLAANPK